MSEPRIDSHFPGIAVHVRARPASARGITSPMCWAGVAISFVLAACGDRGVDAPAQPESATPVPVAAVPLSASGYYSRMVGDRPTRTQLEADPVWQAETLLDSWGGGASSLHEAAEILEPLIERDPENHEALLQLARYAVMSGDLGGNQGALRILEQALAADPGFAEAYVLRGHVLTNLGRDQEAEEALSAAVGMNTLSPWLDLNNAALQIRARRYEAAAGTCNRVIDQKPANTKVMATAYQCRRDYLAQQRDWDAVERDHLATLALRPDDAHVLVNYAWFLCYDGGRCPEAAPLIARAQALADMRSIGRLVAVVRFDAWARIAAAQGVGSPAAEAAFAAAKETQVDLDSAMAHFGSRTGNTATVEALLAKGVHIDALGEELITALMYAAMRGDLPSVRVLLANGADVNRLVDGGSALIYAARDGHLDVVQALVAAGADARSQPDVAIRHARTGWHPEVVSLLENRFSVR